MDIIHIRRVMGKYTLASLKTERKLVMAYRDGLIYLNIRDSSIRIDLREMDYISFPTKISTMEMLKTASSLVKEYYHIMRQE